MAEAIRKEGAVDRLNLAMRAMGAEGRDGRGGGSLCGSDTYGEHPCTWERHPRKRAT